MQCSANGGTAGPCGSYPVGTPISIIPTANSVSSFSGWTNGQHSRLVQPEKAVLSLSFGNDFLIFNRPEVVVVKRPCRLKMLIHKAALTIQSDTTPVTG